MVFLENYLTCLKYSVYGSKHLLLFFQHMIRYRYIPFTFGKPKFARKDEPADVHK
jgi:hypothetical protein